MKFQKNDIVRRTLPSGTMVGGLMIVITKASGKCTAVRDVSTGKCYMYKSSCLEKAGEITKIMISESDMNKIDTMKGIGSFYHEISAVYDKLYQEYETLHKYFGTGENDVMKRLNKIREDRLSE